MTELLAYAFWLGIAGFAWHMISAAPSTTMPISILSDPCDHPYAALPITSLVSHVYDKHFELWNLIGEKDPPPDKWRREHAADHGR